MDIKGLMNQAFTYIIEEKEDLLTFIQSINKVAVCVVNVLCIFLI